MLHTLEPFPHENPTRSLSQDEENVEDLYEHAPCGLVSTSLDGVFIKANETFLQRTGYSRDELIHKKRFQDLMEIGGKIFYDTHYAPQLHMQGFINEISVNLNRANGIPLPVLASSVIRKNPDGQPLLIRTCVFPIAERRQYEAALFNARKQADHVANHDPLTSLPNRTLLEDRLAVAIKVALRHHVKCALLFIDLDHFKQVNDTLGHSIGDGILIETAKRLQSCVRDSDTVSRRSGDEFNILLQDVADHRKVARIADLVLAAVERPYFIEGHDIHISCSVGISLCPDDGTDVKTLLNHADAAMYYAKSQNRNNYQFFSH